MGTVFSAYDIRGRAGDELSVEYVWGVGKAFAEWLNEKGDKGPIVVGKSTQADPSLTHALIEGILLQGRDVVNVGEGGEQTVAGAVNDHLAAGGVLIGHDGIQKIEIITMYGSKGAVVTAEAGLNDIRTLADSGNFLPAPEKGKLTTP